MILILPGSKGRGVVRESKESGGSIPSLLHYPFCEFFVSSAVFTLLPPPETTTPTPAVYVELYLHLHAPNTHTPTHHITHTHTHTRVLTRPHTHLHALTHTHTLSRKGILAPTVSTATLQIRIEIAIIMNVSEPVTTKERKRPSLGGSLHSGMHLPSLQTSTR